MRSTDGAPKRARHIVLDDDLHRRLAAEAAAQGRSMSSVVREAVALWLEPRRPSPAEQTSFWPLIDTPRP